MRYREWRRWCRFESSSWDIVQFRFRRWFPFRRTKRAVRRWKGGKAGSGGFGRYGWRCGVVLVFVLTSADTVVPLSAHLHMFRLDNFPPLLHRYYSSSLSESWCTES